MIYQVYWRGYDRVTHHGYVEARNRDEAYDIVQERLQDGYRVNAVYQTDAGLTPQSVCFNFATPDYKLFG